jgi:hypothetical protein
MKMDGPLKSLSSYVQIKKNDYKLTNLSNLVSI